MWKDAKQLIQSILKEDWAKELPVHDELWNHLLDWISERILPEFTSFLSGQVDEIIEINPDLSEREILETVAKHMVHCLEARSASVRIFDPDTEQLLSYGSYPFEEEIRETYIPLEKSIAGEVVKTGRTRLVPNILKDDLYSDKAVIERKGAYSLMAIPLEISRFSIRERNTIGVIQVYYTEKDRVFTPLEIQLAELMAKRLSFVIARKKIKTMYRTNEKKDAIAQEVFQKLGTWEGVKMKDVFNRVIPELVDIINIESCALFSVADDLEHVVLEAGYPDNATRHGIGQKFPIHAEPAFELILNLRDYEEKSPNEIFTQSYLLVIDPQKTTLVSSKVKQFATNHNINSILYIPLRAGDDVTHFMTFDAVDQRRRFTDDEIEIFVFLGRELMTARRMERLDDILHDFKNPAIATAGFARRLKQLLEQECKLPENATIKKYVDIVFEETSRIQEMAMSISQVGREKVVNLTELSRNRFEINKEVIKELLKQNVNLKEGPFEDPLYIKCYPLQLERVLDNILNNATNAIPMHGGDLSIRTFSEGNQAVVEVMNSGTMTEEERLRLITGKTKGRGGYITHRIIRMLKGTIEVQSHEKKTTVTIRLPIYKTN
ncbi:MAG: GAF domain-containing protein [Deltaproteobacteria bacterium]|nr:GAF domain-containing protein [Deltaproteobacteria bacterium]